jgi:hypothetical protein
MDTGHQEAVTNGSDHPVHTAAPSQRQNVYLVRFPKPAYDEGILQARQAEFQALVGKLRELNEKGGAEGSKKGEGKKTAKRVRGPLLQVSVMLQSTCIARRVGEGLR